MTGRLCRLACWCAAVGLATAVLHRLAAVLPTPPVGAELASWAQQSDPVVAAMALLRVAALGVSWYLVLVTAIGIAARLSRAPALIRSADVLTVAPVRRLLHGCLGAGVTVASFAGAAVPAGALAESRAAVIRPADAASPSLRFSTAGGAVENGRDSGAAAPPAPPPVLRAADAGPAHPLPPTPAARPAPLAPASTPPPVLRPANAAAPAPPARVTSAAPQAASTPQPVLRPVEAGPTHPAPSAPTDRAGQSGSEPPVLRHADAAEPAEPAAPAGPAEPAAPAGPAEPAAPAAAPGVAPPAPAPAAPPPASPSAAPPAAAPVPPSSPAASAVPPVLRSAATEPEQTSPPVTDPRNPRSLGATTPAHTPPVLGPHAPQTPPVAQPPQGPDLADGERPTEEAPPPGMGLEGAGSALPAAPADADAVRSTWTVRRGDSFWRIAATVVGQRVGRAPSTAEVAAYWAQLIEANRDRLVDHDNPDLLFTGQVLHIPP